METARTTWHHGRMTSRRLDPSVIADFQMASMLHYASPDGEAELREALDSIPSTPGVVTLSGHWCSEDNPECESHD